MQKRVEIEPYQSLRASQSLIIVYEGYPLSEGFSLGHCVSTGEGPTLPELLRLRVPQSVGDNYSTFGIFLLNDKTGSRVDAIEDAYIGKPEKITLKILQEWLEGKGLPLTWESLVQTLRDTGLSTRPWRIMLKLPPIFLFFYAHISCLFCFSLCLFFFQTCLFFST